MKSLRLYFKIIYLYLTRQLVDSFDIASSYNKISDRYEELFLNDMHQYNDMILNKYLDLIESKNSLEILDLACGTGYNSNYLNSKLNNSNFTLVDISNEMIQKNKDMNNLNFSFYNEDMLDFLLKEDSNKYDLIVCNWALKYQSINKMLKECQRTLKKGGIIICLINKKQTLFEIREIYYDLLKNNISKINKLMLDLPNPKSIKQFEKKFKKNEFETLDIFEDNHMFVFDNHIEQIEFVINTGALAGYDVMLDLHDLKIKKDMQRLLKSKTITHSFIGGIFLKKGEK